MMFGTVNHNCEAIIKIAVDRLGLPWHYRDVGTLGDGSQVIFEIYKAALIWDGQNQIVDVAASDADPLVGMGLLYGFKLQIEAVEGGRVTIEALN
jgi:predicted aspartyl protease